MPSQTAQLLGLVIDQQLDLAEYKQTLPPVIKENFFIQCKHGCHQGEQAADHLVDEIIKWENGHQDDSLEATLNQKFHITGNYRRG